MEPVPAVCIYSFTEKGKLLASRLERKRSFDCVFMTTTVISVKHWGRNECVTSPKSVCVGGQALSTFNRIILGSEVISGGDQ